MKKLHIASSSFMIPHHKSWRKLSRERDLNFGDYGNWNKSLLKDSDSNELSLIIFIDDFIGNQMLKPKEAINIFQMFFELLYKRLERTSKLTIVSFASLDDTNVINTSKKISLKSFLYKELINKFEKISSEFAQFHMVDLEKEFGKFGLNNVIDNRNWYFAHCRLSSLGLDICARSIEEIIYRNNNPVSKVLVLDCDNTLWGGVVGEDGLDNLVLGLDELGQAYLDFQFEIKKLKNNGIILCLLSKNNEEDVWNVFENHQTMLLKRDDITAWRINWKNKDANMIELSEELNLSLDSFVFWDDNPLERDKIFNSIPEVNTLDVPKEIFEWPTFLRSTNYFAKPIITKEDIKKTEQYKIRSKFLRGRNEVLNEITYLKSIALKPTTIPINNSNAKRAEQMCAKTNQFNLRTIRYTQTEIMTSSKQNKEFWFLINLQDIYGDHGLVSLVGLKDIDNQSIFIDTFLMSCRVLGRYLEDWIMLEIIKIAKTNDKNLILGEFIPTTKNKMCEDFFCNHGFKKIKKKYDPDGIIYSAKIDKIKIPNLEAYNEN